MSRLLVYSLPATISVLIGVVLGAAVDATSADDREVTCTFGACHVNERSASHLHLPVAKGYCKICHRSKSPDRHEFTLAERGDGLCTRCHREIDARANPHNDLLDTECVLCHDPHGSEYRSLLPAAGVADLCEGCHADLVDGRQFLHTPVATDPCTSCHDPHAAFPESGPDSGRALCLGCHETIRWELSNLENVHAPLIEGGCDQCHDAHGSDHADNLRREVSALCDECHAEVRTVVETAIFPHAPAGEPGGCLQCHSPHASAVGSLLKSDPLTVCGACHTAGQTTESGRAIAPVSHEIEVSAFLHGPVRQRDCGACHDSHGGDREGLLVERYTSEFYAPFDLENFRLCFSCHPERKILTERSTLLTDFRNGDLNLHFLHVNKSERGRTCRACHATHASDTPEHIRESVDYGRWKMPLTFTKTETGGRCESGCHASLRYDRERPVQYELPTAPPAPAAPRPAEDDDPLAPGPGRSGEA